MDYLDFVEVAKIVEVKGHLTPLRSWVLIR